MPLDYEGMPDEVFPTATHFFLGPKYHPDKGITIGSETGTCITLPAAFSEYRKTTRLHEVAPEKLHLRPAVVLDIPKTESEEISDGEVSKALAGAEFKGGEAVLVRTGWGDTGVHTQRNDRYVLKSPHFSLQAAELLAAKMRQTESDLLLTDTALIGWPSKHLIPEWCSLLPRPGPWPSPEARVYLHLYTPEKAKEDFAIELVLAKAGIMTIKKLVHCGTITKKKVRVIVAPLQIVRGVASTCRVVALED